MQWISREIRLDVLGWLREHCNRFSIKSNVKIVLARNQRLRTNGVGTISVILYSCSNRRRASGASQFGLEGISSATYVVSVLVLGLYDKGSWSPGRGLLEARSVSNRFSWICKLLNVNVQWSVHSFSIKSDLDLVRTRCTGLVGNRVCSVIIVLDLCEDRL